MDNGASNGISTNNIPDSAMSANNVPSVGNGLNDTTTPDAPGYDTVQNVNGHVSVAKEAVSLDQLQPNIRHITEGFLSLPRLLARRAQVSHNTMIQMIQTLADAPMTAPQTNGVPDASRPDDTSIENTKKKVQFLKYAEKEHADWVKALVITAWARVSDDVRKLIDLKVHIDTERLHYDFALDKMVETKRNLIHARLPNPDLKTALEILSTGRASWMPDLGYIDVPPLPAKDLLQSLYDLNITLATRLSLHEHDTLPLQFKDFTIQSGRVTFHVPTEFELDLTIAEDTPNAQFWFIDFRLLFSPALSQIPATLRNVVENRVNALLEKEGLLGAYKYLHELTLTQKLGELKRQAHSLCRERWEGSLMVEPLHRALSIQYWTERHNIRGSKNWIILGVHSGRTHAAKDRSGHSSRIQLRWFRDATEVKDCDIELDTEHLSAERLIQAVIQEHTFHTLHGIYAQLRTRPSYQGNLVSLHTDSDTRLVIHLTSADAFVIRIEHVTGRYALSGRAAAIAALESKLNSHSRTLIAVAQEIESCRSKYMCDKVVSQSSSYGWSTCRNPGVSAVDLKAVVPKDTIQVVWLRRHGWHKDWFLTMSSGAAGESFCLYRITGQASTMKISASLLLPQTSTTPELRPRFYMDLLIVSAALISSHHNADMLRSAATSNAVSRLGPRVPLISPIMINISKLIPSEHRTWVKDIVKMTFRDIEPVSISGEVDNTGSQTELPHERVVLVVEAVMVDPIPANLNLMKRQIDKDIAFHHTCGAFAVRLYQRNGESVLPELKDRLIRMGQLIRFMHVINRYSSIFTLDKVSLRKIILSYNETSTGLSISKVPRHQAYITYDKEPGKLSIAFERGNPHVHLIGDFTRVLNSQESLSGVAILLPLTLPVLRAFNDIEDSWSDDELGEVILLSRAADHHIFRWVLSKADMQIDIEVKLQSRNGEAWWSIRRPSRAGQQTDSTEDALSKKVWSVRPTEQDADWAGMLTSAIARRAGVKTILGMINVVIKDLSHEVKVVEDVSISTTNKEPAAILPPKKSQLARPTLQNSATSNGAKAAAPSSLMNRANPNQHQPRLHTQLQQQQQKRMKKETGDTIIID